MEATSTRPSVDRTVAFQARWSPLRSRCRVRAFSDARVVAVTEDRDNPGPSAMSSIEDAALAIEEDLDEDLGARFFRTNWRLVEHRPARCELVLVTFRTCRSDGRLGDPERNPAPAAMDWLLDALR
jgi:hypothetical protein